MGAKLDPLDVKSLGEAESEEIVIKEKPPCEHYFVYKSAGEIICRKCNCGLFIKGDELLKNGHLHSGGKRVI